MKAARFVRRPSRWRRSCWVRSGSRRTRRPDPSIEIALQDIRPGRSAERSRRHPATNAGSRRTGAASLSIKPSTTCYRCSRRLPRRIGEMHVQAPDRLRKSGRASRELGLPAGGGLMARIVDVLEEDGGPHGLRKQRIVRALTREQAEAGHARSQPMEARTTAARGIGEASPIRVRSPGVRPAETFRLQIERGPRRDLITSNTFALADQ